MSVMRGKSCKVNLTVLHQTRNQKKTRCLEEKSLEFGIMNQLQTQHL